MTKIQRGVNSSTRKTRGSRKRQKQQQKIRHRREKTLKIELKASHQSSAAIAMNPIFRRFHELRSVHNYPKQRSTRRKMGKYSLRGD